MLNQISQKMKARQYFFPRIIKIIFIFLIFLNSALFFGQDIMEDAHISLSFSDENELKTITATVTDKEGLPIEDIELYFYVQRTFSLLPIGDFFNTTDENGKVVVIFPNDLPGDSEGNVILFVKITESDMYNDLSIETVKNWGLPTVMDETTEERSLWAAAANAPIVLILITSLLIIAVWSIIIFIMFNLFKISRIRK